MYSDDIKVGQTVTVDTDNADLKGKTFWVLDRHPQHSHWWLHDQATGEVGTHLFAHAADLRLVRDEYRDVDTAEVDGVTTLLHFVHGNFAVTRSGDQGWWNLVDLNRGGLRISTIKGKARAEQVATSMERLYDLAEGLGKIPTAQDILLAHASAGAESPKTARW